MTRRIWATRRGANPLPASKELRTAPAGQAIRWRALGVRRKRPAIALLNRWFSYVLLVVGLAFCALLMPIAKVHAG